MNKQTIRRLGAVVLSLPLLLAAGCDSPMLPWMGADTKHGRGYDSPRSEGSTAVMAADKSAAAVRIKLLGTKGEAAGEVTLTPAPEGVRLQGEALGLKPGEHGFHIHESGACVAPDFTSAGGHLNPGGHTHGMHSEGGAHAGDLPNLVADAQGKARIDVVAGSVTLEPGKPNSLLKEGGTSLVIHEKPDDYKSAPAGNAGARIACGVIKAD
ncbi:superoxide dismutase, Cu-Zn family [Paenibacillus sp. UNCCL117]|uniref:superoxide dismutase family protein n=1 Tax=unclassified Paenibacillus TaxID=185978 RepID=UPI000884E6F4|nr:MULTISPECIES: superoxide dismutase family protein [unclassified Paenibacillus]SDC50573.1 superoxide dismutase, Cu-Zn family [Paenibacillus sp. cl123]SFW11587.1 superoxide dismutase, Cu-Zn family [Paenibacillus sp. UNCCL117]